MNPLYELVREGLEAAARAGILPSAFFLQFVANAVIAILVVGPLLGVMGTMVVIKRMAFFSQAIGNAALTGVSIGVLLGESNTTPYVSTFAFCILFGLVMKYTQHRTNLSSDVLIGVFLSISLAIGASLLLFVSARMNTHMLEGVMFGSVLTVGPRDLDILIAVAAITVAIGTPLYNRMLLGSFSADLAGARGVNVRAVDYLFVLLITIVTVACVKVVGAVLVEALLVIPAAAARNVTRSLAGFVGVSVAIATLSGVLGVVVPVYFNLPLPSGGAIILFAAFVFGLTAVARALLPSLRTAG
jgi:zinc transport system permease protein